MVTTPAPTTIPFVKTFSFFKTRKEWVEAVQFCASKGLRLAIISTVAELQRARDLVMRVDEDVCVDNCTAMLIRLQVELLWPFKKLTCANGIGLFCSL